MKLRNYRQNGSTDYVAFSLVDLPSTASQVLQNLIGSALKFRGATPPRVHIEAEQSANEWTITVDDGIGIAADYHERIFVILQRLHTRAAYEGTGIGLAICRKVVERMAVASGSVRPQPKEPASASRCPVTGRGTDLEG